MIVFFAVFYIHVWKLARDARFAEKLLTSFDGKPIIISIDKPRLSIATNPG
jgi:hypothetical protein